MQHIQNTLKTILDGICKHESKHSIILYNVLACLILRKYYYDVSYDTIYNKNNSTSFISSMKSKYNLDVIILEPVDIEKIKKCIFNDIISIHHIITILNLKNINYNQNNYISYVINQINHLITDKSSVLIMSSLFGEFNLLLSNIKASNIDIFDINNDNAILSQMEYDLNYSKNLNSSINNILSEIENNSKNDYNNINIRCEDYIHTNAIYKSYDMILCNFPTGLRNIIHADCCDKIKRLKIRGTKSEPLILQLIMMSLNNNGKACIIVPNTLLNNDSKQHIETRNYLINNFNVSNIINCDNNLSILCFEKNGLTKQTTFSQIKDNQIVKLFDVYYDKIVKRNYNLYYEKYVNIDCTILPVLCQEKKTLNDIVDVIDSCDSNNCNYLSIPKFFNENQKVEIMFDDCVLSGDNISLRVRDNNIINQKYFNYYFLYMLSPHLLTTTIGKSKKLDINTLLSTEISIPSLSVQNKITEFFDINYMTINQTKKQIESIQLLKYKYIETICDNYPMIKIKDICDVDSKPINNPDCNYNDSHYDSHILCVQRNSKSAGNTFYYNHSDSNNINTNVYYLNNIKNYKPSSLYILLKHNEANLNKLASITNTINLSRTNLENFEIKNIPIDIQEKLIMMINKYDNMLKLLLVNTENLLNVNIFN